MTSFLFSYIGSVTIPTSSQDPHPNPLLLTDHYWNFCKKEKKRGSGLLPKMPWKALVIMYILNTSVSCSTAGMWDYFYFLYEQTQAVKVNQAASMF